MSGLAFLREQLPTLSAGNIAAIAAAGGLSLALTVSVAVSCLSGLAELAVTGAILVLYPALYLLLLGSRRVQDWGPDRQHALGALRHVNVDPG